MKKTLCILLAGCLLLLCSCKKQAAEITVPQQAAAEAEQQPQKEEPVYIEAEISVPEAPASEQTPDAALLPYDLGQGLVLTAVTEVAGNFPEDGSDEFVPSLLAVTVENNNDRTVQYAALKLTLNGADYAFAMSTIPAGRSVRVFETNRQAPPETVETLSGSVEQLALFPEEPSLHADALQIELQEGGITVTNISGNDIPGEISVFYKNVYGELFQGGITYRLRIPGLSAGQSVSGYAAHAAPGYSEIMFVTYG